MLPSEILEQGWCQGVLWDDGGNHCFLGAVNLWSSGKAYLNDGGTPFIDLAVTLGGLPLCPERGGPNRSRVVYWNNDRVRTQEEVVELARAVEVELGLRPDPDLGETEEEWTLPQTAPAVLVS